MQFSIVAGNVLTMLAFMLCGYLLVAFKKGTSAHAKTLSAILIYLCCPAMIVSAWQSIQYSKDNFLQTAWFFCVSLIIQLLFFGALFFVFRKKFRNTPVPQLADQQTDQLKEGDNQKKDENAKYRLLTVGATLGNVGFFGLPLVTTLFPEQPTVACFSTVYMMSMNLMVFTVGVFMLTGDKKHVSIKSAIINPSTLSVLFALPFFFFEITFPPFLLQPLDLLGKMSTPLCMMVLGMRLASANKKNLFTRPTVYLGCLLKLIVFPLFAYALVAFLPFFDATFKACILVLSATPSGVIILSLAEFHETEQELSANIVLLSTLLATVTMPLIMLVL